MSLVVFAPAACGGASHTVTQAEHPPVPKATQAELPPVPKLTCAQRSEGHFSGGYSSDANLVVGPLSLIGARSQQLEVTDARSVRKVGGVKFPLIVRNGSRATITIGSTARSFARLSYGHASRQTPLAKLPAAIRLRACHGHQRSHSKADGRPVTFWSGFVMLGKAPACVPLEIAIDDHRTTTRMLRIATTGCP